jgi:hypothetical protein
MIPVPSMLSLAQDYLDERRRLGFALDIPGAQLLNFAQFADRAGYQRIESALQTAVIAPPRTLRQSVMPPRDHDRKQQQRLHARGEHGVTRVDGILAVAQLMGEADLPLLGMSLLGAIQVGDPQYRAVAVEHFAHNLGSTAATHDMDDHVAVLEHPVPAALPVDAHAGFVGLITREQRRRARIAATSASTRTLWRRKPASSAPSLIARPNRSRNSRDRRW